MVSESVSCPVSMMIGALKPCLRRDSHGLASVDIGQPYIHDNEIRNAEYA
jgi:hypothetical protein